MRFLQILLLASLISCDSKGFESDKRQVAAKDAIRQLVKKPNNSFNVVSFRQDTLTAFNDTLLQHPIKYTLHFTYIDSLGTIKQQTGEVLFPQTGTTILSRQVIDQP